MNSFSLIASSLLLSLPVLAQDPVEAAAPKPTMDIVETAVSNGSFGTLVTAVKAAGLVETLQGKGPFTVFAPTDAAFGKLPDGTIATLLKEESKKDLAGILTYHVVSGKKLAKDVVGMSWIQTVQGQNLLVRVSDDGVTIDGAKVVMTDIHCTNGVIHVIDTVVLPRKDIVGVAAEAGTFTTLIAAAKAAGLAEALMGDGPFTVFAPSDKAFAKLPAGTIPALLKDKEKLAAILKYHVVPGRVLSTDLPAEGVKPQTLLGKKLDIKVAGGVTVNGAKVTAADVIASNGVIHVIDTVILPE